MEGGYRLAMLFDVFVRRMFPFQVGKNDFTSIREGGQRFAKAVQCLAARDAIARGKPHIY